MMMNSFISVQRNKGVPTWVFGKGHGKWNTPDKKETVASFLFFSFF